MIELEKYTSQIEEKLLTVDQRNNVQNSQIKNIILDSFLLGHIAGGNSEPLVKFHEFQMNLDIIQQLRFLIDIKALEQSSLIELYNNIFVNQLNLQDEYTLIESKFDDKQDNFKQEKFSVEKQNLNTQIKLLNQEQQQIQSPQLQSQSQTNNQQKKQQSQNFSNSNENQFNNFHQNQQQVNNQPNNFQFHKQFPEQLIPSQNQFKQLNFHYFNGFPQKIQEQTTHSEGIQQIKGNGLVPTNPQCLKIQNQQSKQQPFKISQFSNKNSFQEQFQEIQQNQFSQFPKKDTFIINEIKQMRASQLRPNNLNQQQELRKTLNIARIQQFHPVQQQMKLDQDENKELEQQSIILAQKLQQEFDQEDQDIIKYNFKNDCDICYIQINFKEMIVLNCGHIFHIICLNQTCLTRMQQRQFPIYCPNQYCKKPIIYNDLAEILDKVNLELYQQLTFQQYIESHGDEYSWCPTPDCKFVFLSEGDNYFICPVCIKQYCLNCKAEFHHGQTCEQFMSFRNMNKEDRQFYQFVQGAKFKQCPSCKFWVEKNEGCNHMTCKCKFEFCYTCGLDYKLQCKCKDNNIIIFQAFN